MTTDRGPFHIESLSVEGGFLDGLTLSFRPGLNVLIGPRGAGKTSVIELLRFALGSRNVTEEGATASRQHALSVLGDGRVTVTVRDGKDRLTFSRSATDDAPSLSTGALRHQPLVLSQGEIERVGLDAMGRLRIVDAFLEGTDRASLPSDGQYSFVRSQTSQLREIAAEVALLSEKARELPEARAELLAAEGEDERMRLSAAAVAEDLATLDEIGRDVATVAVGKGTLERSAAALREWLDEVRQTTSRAPILEYDTDQAAEDPALTAARARVDEWTARLDGLLTEVAAVIHVLDRKAAEVQETVDRLNANAVEVRRKVESVHEGAGEAARRLASLRERVAQLESMTKLATQRGAAGAELRKRRDAVLDEIDRQRDQRYSERKSVVESINEELRPQINVRLEKGAQHSSYVAALSAALRGSGLKYSALAPRLAEEMSPRELVDAVDSHDAGQVASVAGIGVDRAERLVSHLRDHGLDEIVGVPIEDGVKLGLWDGTEHRETQSLSTGQRCTVVLPILLLHRELPVVVDQPEDNLDNAFIVDSLVNALLVRGTGGQVICATHNPNIPVLGSASCVIAMDSDGRRGFRRAQGDVDEPEIVEAITTVMEGGREAFSRRAQFYGLP